MDPCTPSSNFNDDFDYCLFNYYDVSSYGHTRNNIRNISCNGMCVSKIDKFSLKTSSLNALNLLKQIEKFLYYFFTSLNLYS